MSKRTEYRTISADGYKAMLGVHNYVQNCGLPLSLTELVCLRCSQINGCAFCIDMHSQALLKEGVAAEKLLLLSAWREAAELYSAQEQAALAWAEKVTRVAEAGVSDAEYAAAREVFSEKELVDLTIAIATINAFNRLGVAFSTTPASVRQLQRSH